MRVLALMILGLMVVGCGTPADNTFKASTHKELTLEEKVVGTYEEKDIATEKWVFLANGISEYYKDNKKTAEFKWTISKDGEIHIIDEGGGTEFLRINKDRFSGVLVSSITSIAKIVEGKRTDYPKDKQITFKKIK